MVIQISGYETISLNIVFTKFGYAEQLTVVLERVWRADPEMGQKVSMNMLLIRVKIS